MTTKWFKYTWVCNSECDALIEYTFRSGYTPNVVDITCMCGSDTTLLSVDDATISPTPTTKEEQMDTPTEHLVPDTYNTDLLVTYKKINGYSNPEYITDKVRNIEWELANARQTQKTNGVLSNKISTVKDIITEAYADSDDQDTLRAIAEALDIELIREVLFTATLEVSGTYSYNVLDNDYELDLDSEVTDALYADSNNGNIQIDDTEVCHVREA